MECFAIQIFSIYIQIVYKYTNCIQYKYTNIQYTNCSITVELCYIIIIYITDSTITWFSFPNESVYDMNAVQLIVLVMLDVAYFLLSSVI